jgi:hypothetical protein
MTNPVAPGDKGYNLLSKRHLFRVVLLKGTLEDDDLPIKGPLVLEAKDGSYKLGLKLAEAMEDEEHLFFEFYVKDRSKPYRCYFQDQAQRFTWDVIPRNLIDVDDLGRK